jgi:hypothetical protein
MALKLQWDRSLLACSQNCKNRLIASSRLFVLTEQIGSHWKECYEILHLRITPKPVEKIQASLQSDMNKGYLT